MSFNIGDIVCIEFSDKRHVCIIVGYEDGYYKYVPYHSSIRAFGYDCPLVTKGKIKLIA